MASPTHERCTSLEKIPATVATDYAVVLVSEIGCIRHKENASDLLTNNSITGVEITIYTACAKI